MELMHKLFAKIPAELRSPLEAVLGASHRWAVKQLPTSSKSDRSPEACPLCGETAEGPQHVWMSCQHPCVGEVRAAHQTVWQSVARDPPAFQAYGWLRVFINTHVDRRDAKLDPAAGQEFAYLRERCISFRGVGSGLVVTSGARTFDGCFNEFADRSAKSRQFEGPCLLNFGHFWRVIN